ncbi:MAG: sodium:solute symporter family protein, partial [Planctomycetota bacterium]
MTRIDWAMVVAWVVGTSALGVYYRRYVASTRDYLLAGRRLRWWQIGIAQSADAVDANDFVAITGHGYRTGLAQLGYTWWGMGIGSILLSRYVAPLLYRTGVYTNAEYLELRFGPALRVLSAVLQVLYRSVAMALVVYAVAIVFKEILGMELWLGVCAAMALSLLYALTSGQLGVVMAAIPQMVLMLLTAVLVFSFALVETGGWEGFCRHADQHEELVRLSGYKQEGVPGGVYVWGVILTLVTYPIVNQTVAQRILGAASEADGRKGTIVSLVPWCVITGASILVGIMAVGILPNVSGDSVEVIFPRLMKRYLPPGVLGLGVAALTVASMSTAAGIGTAISGLLTVDIFRMLGRRQISDHRRLMATRLFAAAAIVFGTVFAMFIKRFGGMIPFYVAFTGTFFLPLVVPYLGGAWFKWVGRGAGTAALVGGIGVGAVLFLCQSRLPVYLGHDQWRPFWVLAVAWVVLIVWSLVENAVRGKTPETELASILNVRDLGRPGTPEEIGKRITTTRPSARPS